MITRRWTVAAVSDTDAARSPSGHIAITASASQRAPRTRRRDARSRTTQMRDTRHDDHDEARGGAQSKGSNGAHDATVTRPCSTAHRSASKSSDSARGTRARSRDRLGRSASLVPRYPAISPARPERACARARVHAQTRPYATQRARRAARRPPTPGCRRADARRSCDPRSADAQRVPTEEDVRRRLHQSSDRARRARRARRRRRARAPVSTTDAAPPSPARRRGRRSSRPASRTAKHSVPTEPTPTTWRATSTDVELLEQHLTVTGSASRA